MKINGYILANRAQEVPIPTPGEPVEATITGGNIIVPYRELNQQGDIETLATRTYTATDVSSWQHTSVPFNFVTGQADFISLYPETESGGVGYFWAFPTKGSFTLNIGNTLPVGKYVFENTIYIGYERGYWSTTPPTPASKVVASPVSTRIIRVGAHGAIEGVLNPNQVEYEDLQSDVTNLGCRTIETRLRYAFNIAEGDTTKVFEWGEGTDIDLADLWSTIEFIALNPDGSESHAMGSLINARYYYCVKVYKGA